jgi:hypothetical protein
LRFVLTIENEEVTFIPSNFSPLKPNSIPVIFYDHDILHEDNTVLHCVWRERSQLLIVDSRITHLLNGIYDGSNSWRQVVRLKEAVRVN